MDRVERDLKRLWVARDQAGWVSENFMTDDTEEIAARTEAATSEYVARASKEALAFRDIPLPPELARKLYLLRLSQIAPAPNDDRDAKELADALGRIGAAFGRGRYCPPKGSKLATKDGSCLHLDALSAILAQRRNNDELVEAWNGWQETARGSKDTFARYVELGNEGARELGFSDMGELWRSMYDMPAQDFESDMDRIWAELKPFYEDLHCFVRARLRNHYGPALVPEHEPIQIQLLANMWGQHWTHLSDLVLPYPSVKSLDVGSRLRTKKMTPAAMMKFGETFFTSLGFGELPSTFWERSLFVRPRDREVVCHPEAYDLSWNGDLRVKMCVEPTEEDLVTIHHELGHLFYFQQYKDQPILFQQGANLAFHEGIGDAIGLSVTPAYLKERGLLDEAPQDEKSKLNEQMRVALDKVAFLPFGLMVDKWRWEVFSGKTTKDRYNQRWWELRRIYQGVKPPAPRSENDFDAGSKFHVVNSNPYAKYFLAGIYQFQFHRALCRAAGHGEPLADCSVYGNAAAGERLRAALRLGARKPWPEVMAALSGERQADSSAILEYFAPLRKWLTEQNKSQQCGF